MPRQLRLTMDPDVPLRTRLTRWAEEHEVEIVFFDPPEHFDQAIVGLVHGFGQETAVLYDEQKVILAMRASGMDPEDVDEWFETNTIGAWVGEATPRFLIRPWLAEEPDVPET